MRDDQYKILATELQQPQYQNKTPEEIAEMLNAPAKPVLTDKRITWRGIMKVLGLTRTGQVYAALEQMAATNKALTLVMKMMEDFSESGGVALNHRDAQQFLALLVQQGVITADERAAIEREVSQLISRREELGLPEVHPGHVTSALAKQGV